MKQWIMFEKQYLLHSLSSEVCCQINEIILDFNKTVIKNLICPSKKKKSVSLDQLYEVMNLNFTDEFL